MMSGYNNIFSFWGMKRYHIYAKMLFNIKYNSDIILAKEKELRDMINNDDLCFCGSGKKYEDCCNDVNKQGVIAHTMKKYTMLDEKISNMKNQGDIKFICEKGCSSCCSEYFYISQVEYLLIRCYLIKNGRDLNILVNKSKRYMDKLKALSEKEYIKLERESKDAENSFCDIENIKEFLPCIFLRDNICSIYEVRPFICRLYGISSRYTVCEKVLKKSKKLFSSKVDINRLNRITVPLPYDEELSTNIDYFINEKGIKNIRRPYPLFWWFAHDNEFEFLYDIAKNESIEEFKKTVFCSNGTEVKIT